MGCRHSTILATFMSAALLVACGAGTPSPGMAVSIGSLKTEYRTTSGTYVGCNNTQQPGGNIVTRTSFSLRFTLAGRPDTATLALKGTTSTQYDAFYTQTLTGGQLSALQLRPQAGNASGTPEPYRAILSADATSSLYLSQPSGAQPLSVGSGSQAVKVKTVRVSGLPTSGVYAQVTATGAGAGSAVATSAETVPVYDRCTVLDDHRGDRL